MLSSASAQTFTISDAGEVSISTGSITVPGTIRKNFGMTIAGTGRAKLQVKVGNQKSKTTTTFDISNTLILSFFFSNDLAEDIDISFRRGIYGPVTVEVLDESGIKQASTTIQLNVNFGKAGCTKHPSKKLKSCSRANTAKISGTLRRKLAKAFARSLRKPIVLEPVRSLN